MSSIDAAVVVDVARLQRVFARLQFVGGGKDLARSVAASLLSSSEMAFEQEKEPDGERWHDWSDPYRKWRTRKGYMPGKILTLNGDLARRLTTDYGDTWALIGSNEPYAAIHQWGGLPGIWMWKPSTPCHICVILCAPLSRSVSRATNWPITVLPSGPVRIS